ncbi:MAG: Replication-associated recombination protein A [candidate division WS2 bacterium ADurb.Bin280]|uniref:Replication-associated recombination protein A n=1 Tax=candidate division WS2 bacterium ADurb.Bin280 TaxID=1852829 RepID=A0A1V5SFT7_9BACT|nr:MAG: Replication-associated recombination protein A [candidate division WS2 bacterium ADurb.Bin280]
MPLANDLRPKNLEEFVGQEHLIAKGSWIYRAIKEDRLSSIILFGPPGSGKTTLAHIIAEATKSNFVQINAVLGTIKGLKLELEKAKDNNERTIIFIDEIHRFNKAQQDVLLPYVERGDIVLIGATTENPSFTVISPIISRSKILQFERLNSSELEKILNRALKINPQIKIDTKSKDVLINSANGDARILLNLLDDLSAHSKKIDKKTLDSSNIVKTLKYDKNGEEHYNIISALHKSMRDSDPDGAIYWLMRMLDAGEDPLYIARRIVRFASEDIGLADPHALLVAVAAYDACRFIGLPECDVHLVQAAIHLSYAPKSNACYKAVLTARGDIKKYGNLDVPKHLRNAPTKMMKGLGYGKGYKYAHDFNNAKVEQDHLPERLKGAKYYKPTDRGLEKKIKEKLDN